MEAYCVKCKAKQPMKDPTETTMKNGKPATTGTCSVCGTKMFKIGSSAGSAGAAAGTNKK
jgi:RNase P subunit RPR2